MDKNKVIKTLGLVGITIVAILVVLIIGGLAFNSIGTGSGKEALFSAFGGAFFAYVFVRIGDLFNRLSKREKLNLDTVVEQQYVLNDHLNRIDLNIKIADALIELVSMQSNVIYTMRFKPIPVDKSRLQDMKNLDFINDMFSYYVDIEKINDGLDIILEVSIKLIEENSNRLLSGVSKSVLKEAYKVNSEALAGMINDSKSLLKTAEADCMELIAKSQYVYEHRNIWLSLAYSGRMGGHYADDLKSELPKLLTEIEKNRSDNEVESKKKIEKTLGREIK